MKISGRPVRTTVLFGLLAAAASVPAVTALDLFLPGSRAFCLTVWFTLSLYGLMLARWAGNGLRGIGVPLLLLLLCALLVHPVPLFLLVAAGVLSWIRSGVCIRGPLLRTLAVELAVSLGGGALVLALAPHSAITWALGIWLFFLVQSLYFVLSGHGGGEEEDEQGASEDRFEQARMRAERILNEGP